MKKMTSVWMLSIMLIGMGSAGAVVTDVALYNLGEDDPGAAAGGAGNAVTVDAIAGIDLPRFGNPTYSSETVMELQCSALAMNFDGSGDYYQSAAGDVPTTVVDNIGMEAWCKANTFGAYQFVANLGFGGGDPGGFGLIEQAGNWRFLYNGIGYPGISTSASVTDQWVHLAGVIDGGTVRLFVNGVEEVTNTDAGIPSAISDETDHMTIAGNPWDVPNGLWNGLIDHVRIFTFSPGEFDVNDLTLACVPLDRAGSPHPPEDTTDVLLDTALSWVTPGEYSPTAYDLYLKAGDDAFTTGDVSVVTGIAPIDPRTMVDPPQNLTFGTTYYWRVDSYRPGFSDPCEGNVWSFTTEQLAYPVQDVSAMASSVHAANMGPEKTVDGSGLDDADQHGTIATDMWLSSATDTERWIQYEFTKPQKLYEMWVWNSNQSIESLIGFGSREVTIETSGDGIAWTALAGVPEFSRAPGSPNYSHNTVVDFGGVTARYVRLTIHAGWGVLSQIGLSEVRFFAAPVYASEPRPAPGSLMETVDVALAWRAGRGAAAHEVYLGTDANDLVLAGTTGDSTFTASMLDYNTSYYWRIDEVNEAETPPRYEGELWDFSTPPYFVIDDFEKYDDKEFLEIWAFWADGYNDDNNGAIVGNGNIGERTVVHGGSQSMPIQYNNSGAAGSEVTLQIGGLDWTASGIKSLSLYFRGTVGNTGQLYVKINGERIDYPGDAADIAGSVWQAWNIDLSTVNTNLQSVATLTVGIARAGASGRLLVDDVRLYPLVPDTITPEAPDDAGLVAYYALDGDALDGSGNNVHGTEKGFVEYGTGIEGQALQLDGIDSFIDLGVAAHWPSGAAPRTLCAWAKTDSVDPGWRTIVGYGTPSGGQATGLLMNGATLYAAGYGSDIGLDNFWDTEEWHQVGLTYDGTTVRLYADGIEAATGERPWNTVITVARIGRQVNEAAEFWDGLVDEVRLYDRVLTPAEMAWLAGRTEPVALPF